MKTLDVLRLVICTVSFVIVTSTSVFADDVSVEASHDATIFSHSNTASSGIDDDLFVGLNNNENRIRRALVRFDLAGLLPMWATVDSVSLTMWVNRTQVGNRTIGIHRLISDWNEGPGPGGGGDGGAALSGDVTWKHTDYDDQFWTSLGGDYLGAASAAISVGSSGASYTWGSTTAMTDDVSHWLSRPDSNFGWIQVGDEGQRSSKRFDSRESANADRRPRLTVWYTPFTNCDCPLQGDMNDDGFFDAVDMNLLIGILYFDAEDTQDGQCPTGRADVDSDGDAGMTDLEYLINVLFFNGNPPIDPCGL